MGSTGMFLGLGVLGLVSLAFAASSSGPAPARKRTSSSPSTAPATKPAKDLSKGGVILLLGDSIFDIYKGDQRIEAAIGRVLCQKTPGVAWSIFNHAHGGEYIGPKEGDPQGVSQPLLDTATTGRYFDTVKRVPHADVVVINYGGNDSKVYSPEVFGKKLDSLCRRLDKQYPGATIILCTGMYLDPNHCAGYHIGKSMVPGWKDGSPRNSYLEPYDQQIAKVAAERGCKLADTRARIKQETEQGNWDWRVRGDGDGDPKDDPQHVGDMNWFDNIHPNTRCTELMAGVIVEALLK